MRGMRKRVAVPVLGFERGVRGKEALVDCRSVADRGEWRGVCTQGWCMQIQPWDKERRGGAAKRKGEAGAGVTTPSSTPTRIPPRSASQLSARSSTSGFLHVRGCFFGVGQVGGLDLRRERDLSLPPPRLHVRPPNHHKPTNPNAAARMKSEGYVVHRARLRRFPPEVSPDASGLSCLLLSDPMPFLLLFWRK